jgi:hypothetical protein
MAITHQLLGSNAIPSMPIVAQPVNLKAKLNVTGIMLTHLSCVDKITSCYLLSLSWVYHIISLCLLHTSSRNVFA